MKKLFIVFFVLVTKISFAQYEHFINLVNPYLKDSIRSGFFYFNTPNNFQPGKLYQTYKTSTPDIDNDLTLTNVYKDSLVGLWHYKYQQTYKNIPVEGAGCIEHYKDGSLVYIQAKIADSINKTPTPKIDKNAAVKNLIGVLKEKYQYIFAWESDEWEDELKQDLHENNATYYPKAELIWAVDTLKDMRLIISGNRYALAYKIAITTISPDYDVIDYFVDATTGSILKSNSRSSHNGPADIWGYGSRIIDTQWKGGFTQSFILKTNDDTRVIHTKKAPYSSNNWSSLSETKDNDDNWSGALLTETSTHYHVSNAWDYFRTKFGRTGQNNSGIEVRVRTLWTEINAKFLEGSGYNTLFFGGVSGWNRGLEPSIVAHEFTHGVIHHTSQLGKTGESGALNESFSDIFGLVIHATMLDGGGTDWIIGNFIPYTPHRSFQNPNATSQPDTYLGTHWSVSGDIHKNTGVQNKWFYILAHGESGVNDNSNSYNVSGIGMDKAAKIAYYSMTNLLSSSQYSDAREKSIIGSILLFGECSVEHQATENAWYAVGVGDENDCSYTISVNESIRDTDIQVYPNPSKGQITVVLPTTTNIPVSIVGISGKIVKKFQADQTYFEQDISELTNGVYFVHFTINGNHIVKKLIIQL